MIVLICEYDGEECWLHWCLKYDCLKYNQGKMKPHYPVPAHRYEVYIEPDYVLITKRNPSDVYAAYRAVYEYPPYDWPEDDDWYGQQFDVST